MTTVADHDQTSLVTPELVARFEQWVASIAPGERWFSDKSRTISSCRLFDYAAVNQGGQLYLFSLVDFHFEDGEIARYFVPAEIRTPIIDPAWGLADALESTNFRVWFGQFMSSGDSLVTKKGRFRSSPAKIEPPQDRPMTSPSRLVRSEQSNSSIIYADRTIAKVFRRLSPGINPEVSVGNYLTSSTHYTYTPATLAAVTWHDTQTTPWTVAVLQEFVTGAVDAWTQVLKDIKTGNQVVDLALLGQITAELHLALAGADGNSEFSPEQIGDDDIRLWSCEFTASLTETVAAVQAAYGTADVRTQNLMQTFLDSAPQLHHHVDGFHHLLQSSKSRVHGDFHLGQVLVGDTGKLFIVDFEGEPHRPVAHRTRKTSPLKDVAGMLRSFAYARGASSEDLGSIAEPAEWERLARQSFLTAYEQTARAGNAAFLPGSAGNMREALAAWEMDKALYEIRYELASRPDWAWLPLSALLMNA